MMAENGRAFLPKGEDLERILREKIKGNIVFSSLQESYCVGFVDIVNSTANTAKIPSSKICGYYGTFLNAMSAIVEEFGAKVVKNLGDSILYYFPRTNTESDKNIYLDVLECSLSLIESRDTVNRFLDELSLPPIDYRVSADYGFVAQSLGPAGGDIFGPTVNMCSKINSAASPNTAVIGGDLQQIVRSVKGYEYRLLGGYGLGMKFKYPVYTVSRRKPSIFG